MNAASTRSTRSSWRLGWAVVLLAPFFTQSCDDDELSVVVNVNTESSNEGGSQGGLLVASKEDHAAAAKSASTAGGASDIDPSDIDPSGSASADGSPQIAPSASAPVGDAETWPTVDGESSGTPAEAVPAASVAPSGPGGGHGSGHSDPTGGAARAKYVSADSRWVTFEELASFWYEAPEPEDVVDNPDFESECQYPDFLLEMDGKKVTIEGYVVPISIVKGRVKAFILSRYVANCCFSGMPYLNEWVEVEMKDGEGLDFLPYGTVVTTGTIHVSEAFDEYGYVRSLYRVDADTVVEPEY